MTIRIVTDSTCDLPSDVVNRYAIKVIPMLINVGEQGYRDGVDISRAEFYQKLPTWQVAPTTAAPSPESFQTAYRELAAEGAHEILSIHISESLSATMPVARFAADETQEVAVEAFDSQQLSLGTGFIVEKAAKLAMDGRTLIEIKQALNDQIRRSHVFAALDTLEFLRRSGRMNNIMAGLGSLLQLKPLLKMYAGEATSERVRTSDKAKARVIELLKEKMPLERLAILHTNAEEQARALLATIGDLIPTEDVTAVDITPVIGAHIGPGAIGFATISS